MNKLTDQIQIYADTAHIEGAGDSVSYLLSGIDIAQVVAEFNPDEVLDCFDYDTLHDYLKKRKEEDAK